MNSQVFTAIKYIFLNHYRKWTYKDSSKLPILLLLYFFALYRFWTTDSKYILAMAVLIFVLQMHALRDRKDFGLLKRYTTAKHLYCIFFWESLMVNLLILILILSKSFLWFGICFGLNLLFPFLVKRNNTNISLPLPFSKLDPLTITFFRKNPFVWLILIVCYYVQYQSLSVDNNELFLASANAILFIVLMILAGTREYLSYIVIFNSSVKTYISKQTLATVWNTFVLLIPSFILLIYFRKWELYTFIIVLLTAVYLCLLKYIFFQKDLLQVLISMPFLAGIFFYSINAKITWIEPLIASLLGIVLFTLAVRNFSNILNNLDDD